MKSLSQIKIRKATKKDLDGIYQLFLELIKSEEVSAEKVARFLRDIKKKRKDFEESSKKELSKDICGKNSILFVAEDKNEIIGYISGDILKVKDPFFNPIIFWGGLLALIYLFFKNVKDKRVLFTGSIFLSAYLPLFLTPGPAFPHYLLYGLPSLAILLSNFLVEYFKALKWFMFAILIMTVVIFALYYPLLSAWPVSRWYLHLLTRF